MKTGFYTGTQPHCDDDDNEYVVRTTWFYENGYGEIPDTWELHDVEIEEGGEMPAEDFANLRIYLESAGPGGNLDFVDDRDYDDWDLSYGQERF